VNIAMFTNTFIPHVGGVARSVQDFAQEFRRMGHRVLVVAPVFEGTPENEPGVLRIPAVQDFKGSDFSVPVPIPGRIARALATFHPDIVHSHHPFLLGDAALRAESAHSVPAVFTHHTRYEQYTHYVPGDSPTMKRFVIELVTGYCNLCDAVVAPSSTIASILAERGVKVPVDVIPTGVDTGRFSSGDGVRFREQAGIPPAAFVIGHVGRLAPEKNLLFLGEVVCTYLSENPNAHFLLVGDGPMKPELVELFRRQGLGDRLHTIGVLDRRSLVDAYCAMDVFAFASQSETQGMVLAEAMAAGTPVVAVDAPGVREIVRDGENGRLLPAEDPGGFVAALVWTARLSPEQREPLEQGMKRTAEEFSMHNTARKMLRLYERLIGSAPGARSIEESPWEKARKKIKTQWEIMRIYGQAAEDAVLSLPGKKDRHE
jgi:1,2-diacylglycerol 3-alpha-glucosyltransferase